MGIAEVHVVAIVIGVFSSARGACPFDDEGSMLAFIACYYTSVGFCCYMGIYVIHVVFYHTRHMIQSIIFALAHFFTSL